MHISVKTLVNHIWPKNGCVPQNKTDPKHSDVPEEEHQLIFMGFGAVLQLLTTVLSYSQGLIFIDNWYSPWPFF